MNFDISNFDYLTEFINIIHKYQRCMPGDRKSEFVANVKEIISLSLKECVCKKIE